MIRIMRSEPECELWNESNSPRSKYGTALICLESLPAIGDHILEPLDSLHVVQMRVFHYCNGAGYEPDVTLYVRRVE